MEYSAIIKKQTSRLVEESWKENECKKSNLSQCQMLRDNWNEDHCGNKVSGCEICRQNRNSFIKNDMCW
jgi:hypothetical protein